MGGNQIGAKTLDLNKDFNLIAAQLDGIIEICKQRNILLLEDLREEKYEDEAPDELEEEPIEEVTTYIDDFVPEHPAPKLGFFGTLAAILAGSSAGVTSNQGRRHNGRCNGDCANCPPHYGYRYGRWYYGNDHVHGCEFGGNKGSGSMDCGGPVMFEKE